MDYQQSLTLLFLGGFLVCALLWFCAGVLNVLAWCRKRRRGVPEFEVARHANKHATN